MKTLQPHFLVQTYDIVTENVYKKIVPTLFSHKEIVVNTEGVGRKAFIEMLIPDDCTLIVNGKEYIKKVTPDNTTSLQS